jgi:cytoskeletal protein CcmA (bactofilin family)
MKKQISLKWISVFALLVVFTLVFVPVAYAFDGRGGDNIVIGKDEVINDDLYIAANNFVLDGTVKGDLVVVGQNITINGTVEGDLTAAGQSVTIYGNVMDDARMAGAALTLGPQAQVADDLITAAYSIETKAGSSVGGDQLAAGYQVLDAGDVAGRLNVAAAGLELQGTIGGDVYAEVGSPEQAGPSPSMFMSNMPPVPPVAPGITLGSSAKVGGNLTYKTSKALSLPGGVVSGKTEFIQQVDQAVKEVEKQVTPANLALAWALDKLRYLIALVVVGLLLAWLLPAFIRQSGGTLQAKPWPSLGWGTLIYVLIPTAMMVAFGLVILVTVILGALTLGGLAGAAIFLGLGILMLVTILYILVVVYLTKIVVSYWIGRFILEGIHSTAANNIFWSLLLGLLVLVILIAIPILGWLIKLVATLFGLGMLFLMLKAWWDGRQKPVETAPVPVEA